MRLDAASAGRLAALALACVGREFPNQPGHVMQRAGELDRPRSLHPAFFGCFDWHSAVHGHWLLAHLLRRFPGLPQAGAMRSALDSALSAANLQVEAEYLGRHPEFERPYGWAWALKLAQERGNLQPLEGVIVQAYKQWLPRQTYPVRSGTHTNTAFGLAFALDHAHPELKPLLIQRAVDYFGNDRDYPAAWEPGGNDFFSPSARERQLRRRALARHVRRLRACLRWGLAPRAPAKLRIALARAQGREVEGHDGLERLRDEPEGQRAVGAADARHLHRAVVVARHQRMRRQFHQPREQVRHAIGKRDDEPPAAGDRADELDQLPQRVDARPAQVVGLAVRARLVDGAHHRLRDVADVDRLEARPRAGHQQRREEAR